MYEQNKKTTKKITLQDSNQILLSLKARGLPTGPLEFLVKITFIPRNIIVSRWENASTTILSVLSGYMSGDCFSGHWYILGRKDFFLLCDFSESSLYSLLSNRLKHSAFMTVFERFCKDL